MEKNNSQKITNQVMTQILEHKVKMKPRIYFVLGSFLLALGLLGTFGLAIIFFNLSSFHYRLQSPFGYLWFGQFGFKPFIDNFPWFFILLTILTILGGIWFLHKYDISYKHSFAILIIWMIILVIGAGFLLDQIGLNQRASAWDQIKFFYKPQIRGENWLTGQISDLTDSQMTIITPQGEEVVVSYDKETMLPQGGNFILGDKVRTVGHWQDYGFKAQGIKKDCPACGKIFPFSPEFQQCPCPKCGQNF